MEVTVLSLSETIRHTLLETAVSRTISRQRADYSRSARNLAEMALQLWQISIPEHQLAAYCARLATLIRDGDRGQALALLLCPQSAFPADDGASF